MKCRLLIYWLVLFFQLSESGLSQPRPILTLKNTLESPTVTVYYKVSEPAFVELQVFNRQGFIVEIPLAKQLSRCEDSLAVSVAKYPTGSYFFRCKKNHLAIPIIKLFRHAQAGQYVTYTSEEMELHNKLPACDKSLCTVGELSDYDDFLKKHPNYIDKGEVFQRALLAYVKLDQDSALIARTIDSLATYLPGFYTYYSISRILTEYSKLKSLGASYFVKARNSLGSIPESLQEEYRSKLSEIEKERGGY